MKISARNVLKGKIVKVTPGAVNSEVILELPGGTLHHIDHHQRIR